MEKIKIAAYNIPCDSPESDGTLQWESTTLILVTLQSENKIGLGFSYGHEACLDVIKKTFLPFLKNGNHSEFPFTYQELLHSTRNIGRDGVVAHAISAVDIALWDLKAKI